MMITLRISFLLAIDLKVIDHVSKKISFKKKRRNDKIKQVRTKPKYQKIKSSQKIPISDEDYSVIGVTNPVSYTHISYELFPKKFKYGIDVVCWGPVAKMYTKNGIKCLKTIVHEDIAWIPVCIEHYLNPLSTEEIRLLLKQNIKLEIKMGKNNVGAKAKSDNMTTFYQRTDEVNKKWFSEVYSQRPKKQEIDENSMKAEVEQILKKLLTFPIKHEITTSIFNMDQAHATNMLKIITRRSCGQEIYGKDFYEEEKMPKKKLKNKKNQNNKKFGKKSRKSDKSGQNFKTTLKIPSHVLLSDSRLAKFKVKDTGFKLTEFFILLSSVDMLTFPQKRELCPLVVKIRKISNLPKDVLQQSGFSRIKLICQIPGVTEFETSYRSVSDTVHFDDSRFIITTDVPKIKILELLETRRVTVKVIGVNEANKIVTAQKPEEKRKKNKKNKKTKTSVKIPSQEISAKTLAVAIFDLSSLSKFMFYKEAAQCVSPNSISIEPPVPLNHYFIDRFTPNEANLNVFTKQNTTILNNDNLFWKNSTLKFEAHLIVHPHPLFYIKDAGKTYRRLLMIFFKEEPAKNFLTSILIHNQQFLGPGPLLVPNVIIKKDIGVTENRNQMLSGFLVDDGDSFIFYVEGPANGYILTLLHQVSSFGLSIAKIFHNSNYVFEDRLYWGLYDYSGLVLINLKLPFAEVFSQQKVYIEGNLPIHCLKAIQKFNLIFNSSTLKTVLSHELLPTEIELLSFFLEYGLSVRISAKTESKCEPEESNLHFVEN